MNMSESNFKRSSPAARKKNAQKNKTDEKSAPVPVKNTTAMSSENPVAQSSQPDTDKPSAGSAGTISKYITVMSADERNALAKRWEECVRNEFQAGTNIREESERDHFYRVIAGTFAPALSGSAADFEIRFSFFMQQFNLQEERIMASEERFKAMDKKDENRSKLADEIEKQRKAYEAFRQQVLNFFSKVIDGADVFIYAGLGMFTMLRDWHDRVAKTPAEKKFAFDVYKVMKSTIFIGVLTFLDGGNDENWGKSINVMAPYTLGKIAANRRLKVEEVTIPDIVNCLQLAAYAQLQCERVESIAHMLTPMKQSEEADDAKAGPSTKKKTSSNSKKLSAKDDSAQKRDQRYMNEAQMLMNALKRVFSPYTRLDERSEESVRVSSVASTALFGQSMDIVGRINQLYIMAREQAKKDNVPEEEIKKLSMFDFTDVTVSSLLDEWIRISYAWKKAVSVPSKVAADVSSTSENKEGDEDDYEDAEDAEEDDDYEKVPEAESIPVVSSDKSDHDHVHESRK